MGILMHVHPCGHISDGFGIAFAVCRELAGHYRAVPIHSFMKYNRRRFMYLVADCHSPPFDVGAAANMHSRHTDWIEFAPPFCLGDGQAGKASKDTQRREVRQMTGEHQREWGAGLAGGRDPVLDVCPGLHCIWPESHRAIALNQ